VVLKSREELPEAANACGLLASQPRQSMAD
jgi:hypothetical protein